MQQLPPLNIPPHYLNIPMLDATQPTPVGFNYSSPAFSSRPASMMPPAPSMPDPTVVTPNGAGPVPNTLTKMPQRKFGDMLAGMLGGMNFNIPLSNGRAIAFNGAPIAQTFQNMLELRRQNALAGVNEKFLRNSGVIGPAGIGYLSNDQIKTGIDAQQGANLGQVAGNMGLPITEGSTYNSAALASVLNQYQQDKAADNRVGLNAAADMQKEALKAQLELMLSQTYGPQAVLAMQALKSGDLSKIQQLNLPPAVLSTLLTTFGSVQNNRDDNAALGPLRSAQTQYFQQGGPLREAQTDKIQAQINGTLPAPPAKAKSVGALDAAIEGKQLFGLNPKSPQGQAYAKNRVSGMGPDEAAAGLMAAPTHAPTQTTPVAKGGVPEEIRSLEQTRPGAIAKFRSMSAHEQRRALEMLRQSGRR